MDHADLIIHIIELVVAVIVVPTAKQAISTIVGLKENVALLTLQVTQQTKTIEGHILDDREQFRDIKEMIERRRWARQGGSA